MSLNKSKKYYLENPDKLTSHFRQFDSIAAYGRYVADIVELSDSDFRKLAGHNKRSSINNSDTFCGGSMEQALEIAKKGGRVDDDIAALLDTEAKASFKLNGSRIVFKHGVTGFTPSVPRYVQGHPLNMRKTIKTKKPAPIINLAIDIGADCGVDVETMRIRGVAVINYIKQLESIGYRVRLDAISAATEGNSCAIFSVTLKKSDGKITVADIAFPLTNAMFFRRLGFVCIETSGDCAKELTSSGYGNGLDAIYPNHYDAILPYICNKVQPKLYDQKAAYKYVSETLNDQLASKNKIELQEAAA
jgi:hypothetical protein